MKKSFLSLGVLLAIFAGCLYWVANRQPAGREVFVVGDGYHVSVEYEGVKQQLDGLLVKTTPEWIVLCKLCAGANDVVTGTPILMDLPWIGSWFSKTERVEVMSRFYHWVPRNKVHLEKRTSEVHPQVRAEHMPPMPRLGEEISVVIALAGKPEQIEVRNDFAQDEVETLRKMFAVLNGIGVDFDRDTAAQHGVVDVPPLPKTLEPQKRLLYVESQVVLTPDEVKLVNAVSRQITRN